MWEEFNYTLNLSEKTFPGVEKMVTTCSSAMQAATGAHAIAGTDTYTLAVVTLAMHIPSP